MIKIVAEERQLVQNAVRYKDTQVYRDDETKE